MGALGPIGAYGPLGDLGPLGTNAWNPSTVFEMMGGWANWTKDFVGYGGPLGKNGNLDSIQFPIVKDLLVIMDHWAIPTMAWDKSTILLGKWLD